MKFDRICQNPPYDGNLHVKITNNLVGLLAEDGLVCSIHPARFFTDPLARLKSGTDWQRFPDVINGMAYAELYDIDTANRFFGIENCTDIIISVVKRNNPSGTFDIYSDPLYKSCFDKIIRHCRRQHGSVADHCARNAVHGWRVEVKDILFPVFNREKARKAFVFTGQEAFLDGYRDCVPRKEGDPAAGWWTETVGKSQIRREYPDPIPLSVELGSREECISFRDACSARLMVNWCYMIKTDMHTPLAFLPWLDDYTRPWTDEDLCALFGLTDEESAYMLREPESYVAKDFISYMTV